MILLKGDAVLKTTDVYESGLTTCVQNSLTKFKDVIMFML